MKTSSKWLIGFGAGILVLVVAAIILVLGIPRTANSDLPPADTPEGVVMRYILALGEEDFETATAYLSETHKEKYDYPYIKMQYREAEDVFDIGWKVTMIQSNTLQEESDVEVEFSIFEADAPFSNPVRSYKRTFTLVKEDGSWKIDEPAHVPWPIW